MEGDQLKVYARLIPVCTGNSHRVHDRRHVLPVNPRMHGEQNAVILEQSFIFG